MKLFMFHSLQLSKKRQDDYLTIKLWQECEICTLLQREITPPICGSLHKQLNPFHPKSQALPVDRKSVV